MSVLSLTVSAVMTHNPWTAAPTDSLADVRRAMIGAGGHHVPVVADGLFVGLLSPLDLLHAVDADAYARDPDALAAELAAVTARHAMQEDVLTIAPAQTVRRACEMFASGSFHCLPVVDAQRKLLGLVTTTDIMRTLLQTEPG